MTITSKTAEGKCYRLQSNGGALGEITEVAGERVGTDVCVEMLFYNTPVRLEFLKSDKAEEGDITTFVSRFILNRSDIAFTYYVNNKKVLQSFGGGDEEAMVSVYGAAVLRDCYQIDAEKHGIRIRGYIGNQNFSKPNKSYQSVFLNGRYVLNTTISAAISGAYASYLMKRQYPFYVLHIDMPPQVVDVNVHPNKTDVRFASNQMIYGCINTVIASVLDGKSQALEYLVGDTIDNVPVKKEEKPQIEQTKLETTTGKEPVKSISESILETPEAPQPVSVPKKYQSVFSDLPLTYEEAEKEIKPYTANFTANLATNATANAAANATPKVLEKEKKTVSIEEALGFDSPLPELTEEQCRKGFIPNSEIPPFDPNLLTKRTYKPDYPFVKDPEKLHRNFPDLHYEPRTLDAKKTPREQALSFDTPNAYFAANKRLLQGLDEEARQNKIDVFHCNYVGKLFNTYLLYEYFEDIYIIDQHAAHERLIFDRLKAQMRYKDVEQQQMLVPYEIKLNAFESTFIRERMKDIREMGFDLAEKGEMNFIVTAIPLHLQHINLNQFFHGILGEINNYRSIKLEELLKDRLASAACKAAVKAGMDLTRDEVESLLLQMDGNMGLKCPHGRPIVVKMTKTQLEKMFKRIV